MSLPPDTEDRRPTDTEPCGPAHHPTTPHLHLHLEPEERKRRTLGLPLRDFGSRQRFFAAHRTDRDDRCRVVLDDLRRFLSDVHAEQHAQGADYVELRLSPQRFLTDGMTWQDFTRVVQETLQGRQDPVVAAVLLINRNSPAPFLANVTERIGGLPPIFVGVDVAGDEISHPDVRDFVPLVRAAAAAGLGRTVHAGEFGPAEHIWRALDQLGAQRIGHGLSSVSSRALLRRMVDDHILIEVSLTSNAALGAVTDLAAHPLPHLLNAGVPVAFNTDVPLHTGRGLGDELAEAARLLNVEPQEVKALQTAAARFRFGADRRTEGTV